MIANGSCHYLYDFYQKNTDDSYGYAQKFTDNSSIFSEFLRFSLNFSTYLGFSSYLCCRNSAARKKGGGVIIFIKVLKNDAALPSEIDSRAFRLFTFKRLSFEQINYLTITTYSHDRTEYLLDKNNVLGFDVYVLSILAYLAGYPIST